MKKMKNSMRMKLKMTNLMNSILMKRRPKTMRRKWKRKKSKKKRRKSLTPKKTYDE